MAAKRSRWTHMAAVVAGAAVISAGVSGCGLGRALGVSKSAPDEFAVVTKAPLVLPPDYELRPPKPGEKRPQELEPSEAAKQALFKNQFGGSTTASTTTQAPSAGEQALLTSAGAKQADPAVPQQTNTGNQQINTNNKVLVRKSESFSNKLLFGNENAIPASAVTTAAKSGQPNPAAAENTGKAADEGTDEAEAESADEAEGAEGAEDTDESENEAAGAQDAEAAEESEGEGSDEEEGKSEAEAGSTDEAAEGENEAEAEGTDEATDEDTGDSGGENADESADDEAEDAGDEAGDDSGSQE